ncbi:MAG: KH domain-containing protein [Candidatus Micrarchaeia archaeon]|jgi:ribosomal RNA assembly protein
MQQILIPKKRAELLRKYIDELESRLRCKIRIEDENEVVIEGEPYDEYIARGVITAFGRGFDIDNALKLLSDNYFFKSINLKEIFKNKDRIIMMEGRVIGKEGKSKKYIESVSGAQISIFGGTISLIGTNEEIAIAESAINVLIEGGTHKKAYRVMEAMRKKMGV